MSYLEEAYNLYNKGIFDICVLDKLGENEDDFSNKDWILRISDILTQKATNHGILSYLLEHKVISREDGDHFKDAVRFVYDSEYYRMLFDCKIVTKQDDEELFSEIINKTLENPHKCTCLIKSGVFNKTNNYSIFVNLYKILMDEEKKNTNYNVKNHLWNYRIHKDDKELFEITILSAISDEMNAFNILKENIVNKEDGDLFIKTINAVKKQQLRNNLVKCEIIEE